MGRLTRTNFGWSVKKRLTNAQILTLFSAPITLIAGVPNTVFVPLILSIVADTTAAAYATVANIIAGAATDIGGPADLAIFVSLSDSELDTGDFTFSVQVAAAFANAAHNLLANVGVGEPLLLTANADPTGGDPANYAIVTVEGITLETE